MVEVCRRDNSRLLLMVLWLLLLWDMLLLWVARALVVILPAAGLIQVGLSQHLGGLNYVTVPLTILQSGGSGSSVVGLLVSVVGSFHGLLLLFLFLVVILLFFLLLLLLLGVLISIRLLGLE